MDKRRKLNTSNNQIKIFLDKLEKEGICDSRNRNGPHFGFPEKWKQLTQQLNTCSVGPKLTSEEWCRRFYDWKRATRMKYRKNMSGEKHIKLNPLEIRGIKLLGTTPSRGPYASKKQAIDVAAEVANYSEQLEKQLSDDIEDVLGVKDNGDESDDEELVSLKTRPGESSTSAIVTNQLKAPIQDHDINEASGVPLYNEDDVPSSSGNSNIVRKQHPAETISNNNQASQSNLIDEGEIALQLKRMADIQYEKLRFQVTRYKFIHEEFDFQLKTQ